MGQKCNPISNRLGIIKGWDSNWYGGKKYADKLAEDAVIRKYLNTRLDRNFLFLSLFSLLLVFYLYNHTNAKLREELHEAFH